MNTGYGSTVNEEEVIKFRQLLDSFRGLLNCTFPKVTLEGAQCGEIQFIKHLLPEKGYYVDIGAGEPKQCSNTWELYKQGWRGLLIEPLHLFQGAILRQRPGDFLWPTAASNLQGFAHLRCQGSVSSLEPDWQIEVEKTITVETVPTREILNHFPHIRDNCSVCSVDVEGHEKQVFWGMDFGKFKPKVFIVEYVDYMTNVDNSPKWEPILLAEGYALQYRTELNKIYVRQ